MMKFAVILALVIPCVLSSCNLGWTEFEEKCYGISDEALSWFDAASTCDVYGGNLIEIESQKQQDFIESQLKKQKVGESIWTGGSSRHHHSIWEWVPSFKSLDTYTNWQSGEPNFPDTELCIALFDSAGYKWLNEDCSKPYRFVCEKKAVHGLS